MAHRENTRFSGVMWKVPTTFTPLLGRDREVAAIGTFLTQTETRLLTLTGAAGIGKTRLSLEVAKSLRPAFADGVCFVELAALRDAGLVVPTLAKLFDLREEGPEPIAERLKGTLRDKHLLLLLDNFEHLLVAASQVEALLSACSALHIIVTSRSALRLPAEYLFPVTPLALPDLSRLPEPEVLARTSSVALFVQRAQAIRPDFQLTSANAPAIAEICVRLDGLPLAIELAAARVNVLSPQDLLARLSSRLGLLTRGAWTLPERQQTLRQAIGWSYDLLPAEEQQLFRCLSVFVGGGPLSAVEALWAILGEDHEAGQVLDGVASLIDKSLLQRTEHEGEEPRFVMLETIREYGLEALAMSGELEATRQAHALCCLQFAEEGEPKLVGAEQQRWFARLEREHDNLRTALQWSLERRAAEQSLRLSKALFGFWLSHHVSEGRQWLEQALSASGEGVTSLRARSLAGLGLLLHNLGEPEQAERRCEESLALYRELGDMVGLARPLRTLALVKNAQGEFTRGRSLLEESLARFSEGGDKNGRAYSLCELAVLYSEQGAYDQACSRAQESLAVFQELEDNQGISYALFHLGKVLFVSQRGKAAVTPLLEECLALMEGGGSKIVYAEIHTLLAEVALSQGDLFAARSLIEKSLAFSRTAGDLMQIPDALLMCGRIAAAQSDDAAAQAFYEESLALAREMGFKQKLPACLERLADVVSAQGALVWAARLWGAAEARRTAMGTLIPPVYRTDYERLVAATRTQLGEQDFAAAWAEGRSMTPEQVLAAQEPVAMPTAASVGASSVPPVPKAPAYPAGLTEREVQVLRLVAQGLTNAQIADQLVLSHYTVNNHVRSILSKLGVTSRSGATRFAIEHNLL